MSDVITKDFDTNGRANPFALSSVKICDTKEELDASASPKVVLASTFSLESGFAKDLFVQWASNTNNIIIFTQQANCHGTLASQILSVAKQSRRVIPVTLHRRQRLEGQELQEYYAEEKRKKVLEEQKKREQERLAAVAAEEKVLQSMQTTLAQATTEDFEDFIAVASNATSRSVVKESRISVAMNARMFPYRKIRKLNFSLHGWAPDENDPLIQHMKKAATPAGKGKRPFEQTLEVKSEETEQEPPSKSVSYNIQLTVACRVIFIDFEGRSDGASIKTILSKVNPHKLVFVHADDAAMTEISDYARNKITNHVYTPLKGQTIDVTSEVNVHQVLLSDQLLRNLPCYQVKTLSIAHISAIVATSPSPDGGGDGVKVLKPNDREELKRTGHSVSYVGDVKLSDLRLLLIRDGVQAHFKDQALVCNGQITVKKVEHKFTVEGALSPLYFKVRDILYKQFVVL